jgi:hypothetical protein
VSFRDSYICGHVDKNWTIPYPVMYHCACSLPLRILTDYWLSFVEPLSSFSC